MKFFLHKQLPESLVLREWGAVALLIAFLASIAVLSEIKQVRAADRLGQKNAQRQQAKIAVLLKGAIEHPGVYTCDPGTSLGELLKEAKLAKNADRKQIVLKKILGVSQEVEIPEKVRSR